MTMPPKKQTSPTQPSCGKCDSLIKKRDKSISCSICNIPFHPVCYNISDAKYEVLTEDDSLFWFCNSCRAVTVNIVNKLVNLERRFEAVESENTSLKSNMADMMKQLESVQTKNKLLEEKIAESIEISKQNKDKLHLKIERKDLKIENLKVKVDAIEQSKNNRSVRILGIPEVYDDGSLKDTILSIAKENLDMPDMKCCDIETLHRMGRVNQDKPRDIILTFTAQSMRDEFYKNRKKSPKANGNQIYINENLTAFRAKLFYDIRQLVKRKKVHSTWTQHGNVMLKIEDTSRPIAVYEYSTLQRLTTGNIYEESADEMSIGFSDEYSEGDE